MTDYTQPGWLQQRLDRRACEERRYHRQGACYLCRGRGRYASREAGYPGGWRWQTCERCNGTGKVTEVQP